MVGWEVGRWIRIAGSSILVLRGLGWICCSFFLCFFEGGWEWGFGVEDGVEEGKLVLGWRG